MKVSQKSEERRLGVCMLVYAFSESTWGLERAKWVKTGRKQRRKARSQGWSHFICHKLRYWVACDTTWSEWLIGWNVKRHRDALNAMKGFEAPESHAWSYERCLKTMTRAKGTRNNWVPEAFFIHTKDCLKHSSYIQKAGAVFIHTKSLTTFLLTFLIKVTFASFDERLFSRVTNNPHHVLHQILPPVKYTSRDMRRRSHKYTKTIYSSFQDKTFLSRLLNTH